MQVKNRFDIFLFFFSLFETIRFLLILKLKMKDCQFKRNDIYF